MKKTLVTAVAFRKFLTTVLVILIICAAAGFYLGLQQVRSFAVDVSHAVTDANASGKNIEKLQDLKKALAEREELVSKADKIFASESNYQSQALTDLQKYAAAYGLTLSNTNFDTSTSKDDPVVNGHNFVITLQSPIPYDKFLQFLDAIEGNLPKMQVASIELSRPDKPDANLVKTGDIKITISTR